MDRGESGETVSGAIWRGRIAVDCRRGASAPL